MLLLVVRQKLTGVSEVLTAFYIIITDNLMMEAVSTLESLINFYWRTRRNIPEDCRLNTRRLENLKYHNTNLVNVLFSD
jgi:hypothetical protein